MPSLPRREALEIDGPAGALEALIERAPGDGASGVAVVCHPHPQHGGTMNNKVVHTLCRAANELGLAALRFNFRGVGASAGGYDEGRGETEDALAVMAHARAGHAGEPLWLAGFSFGAAVAIAAAGRDEPDRLVTVAPAVNRVAAVVERQPQCPWLIVQGEDDELVAVDDTVAWVNRLAPGPELVVLPGVDHFFHGKLTLLKETVTGALR